MLALRWAGALVRRRPARVLGASAGIALAVALLGSLGVFLTTAKAQMTRRAVAQVPVDWQVEVQPGGSTADVLAAVKGRPFVKVALPIGFAATTGLEATTGATTQSTGPGVVVGLPPGYRAELPQVLRPLIGAPDGVLLTQQTAANLHAAPGDAVLIGRPGQPGASVTVDGIVEVPVADSLFQRVGAPPGAQPQAPPDNVVFLPDAQWRGLFDTGPDRSATVRDQVHARLDHRLPDDPAAAFSRATSNAHRLEADLAGSAIVGNNLGATLDAARSDALFAGVLFVVLGLPGAVLAGLLAHTVAAASRDARRRELALLRTRGASLGRLQRLVASEAATVAALGAVAGLVVAGVVGQLAFGSSTFGGTTTSALAWALGSVGAGLVVTVVAVAVPAWRDASATTVAAARRNVGRTGLPQVLRYGLDMALLAGAALVFWATSRGHYNLVLAPEGVPTVSVNHWALSGPLLLWAGAGLFAWRVVETSLGRSGPMLRAVLRPIAGGLRRPAASTLHRQRRSIAPGVVLVTLAAAFAISTAVFNTTYRHQAAVEALLTNGAPVTVTEAPGAPTSGTDPARLEQVPGVGHVEALQHRFVYVGADLQDLYGVDPTTIGKAAQLEDAYFAGGTARALLGRLATQPDAALVSAETAKDFQLHPGDRARLRVRDARSGGLADVNFSFVGVVKEFPTAPKDSFIVANAAYVADQTGDQSVSTLLVSTSGASPTEVANRVRAVVGPGARVSDVGETRRVVGSSLTAVNLSGLTRVELGYALLLLVAAAGLVVGLGLAQRRRSFAIIDALGARRRQLAVFARAEAMVFGALGTVLGTAGGWLLAHMLVKVLTGVFDPAPAALSVPWGYLLVLGLCALSGLVFAVVVQLRWLRRHPVAELIRDL